MSSPIRYADENGNLYLRDSDDYLPEEKKYPLFRDKNGKIHYDADGFPIMFPDDRDGFILGPLPGERHGLFAQKSLHLIQGASASGKTTFGLQMLRAQERGDSFCLRPSLGRKSFLVVWQDRGEDELRRQLENLDMDKDPPPYVLVSPERCNMEPAQALAEIYEEQPEGHQPDVLFVEGIDMWLLDNVKDLKNVSVQGRNVRGLAEKVGISIIATLGAPKTKPKEQYLSPRDRAFGSSAWSRIADTVVDITVDPETDERTVTLMSRTARPQTLRMGFEDGLLVPRVPSITVGPIKLPSIREIEREHKVGREKARQIRAEMEKAL